MSAAQCVSPRPIVESRAVRVCAWHVALETICSLMIEGIFCSGEVFWCFRLIQANCCNRLGELVRDRRTAARLGAQIMLIQAIFEMVSPIIAAPQTDIPSRFPDP